MTTTVAVAIAGIGLYIALTAFMRPTTTFTIMEEQSVSEVQERLGQSVDASKLPRTDVAGVSVEAGRRLVIEGIASKPNGGRTARQSKHFLCTSCHNIVKEDPNLAEADPEARLQYAKEQGLPFLPGTTFYGAVNRKTYYNGDYEKKYGDLVRPARHDIRGAITLCATECAQGRELEDWEMESIMAYLWTIDLKMGDLQLTDSEKSQIERAANGEGGQVVALATLNAKFLDHSPATFVTPPKDRNTGYENVVGDASRGEVIYELSCLHCHGERRYSFFNLDESAYSYDFLTKHFPKYTRYSTYQVSRYGTSPMGGKKAYMPHYTAERMSNQQVEDLRAFVRQGS